MTRKEECGKHAASRDRASQPEWDTTTVAHALPRLAECFAKNEQEQRVECGEYLLGDAAAYENQEHRICGPATNSRKTVVFGINLV